jgi:hypothetical protein
MPPSLLILAAMARWSLTLRLAFTVSLTTTGKGRLSSFLDQSSSSGVRPSDSRWTVPALPELRAAVQADFNDPDKYPVDARGLTYSFAYIDIKRLGAAQFYLISIRDKEGKSLDGGKSYRLTVPPHEGWRGVRSHVPGIRSDQTILRKDVEIV